MKSLLVVAVFTLFGAALGADPCCAPTQWEGMISEFGGVAAKFRPPKLVEEGMFYAYDEKNDRVAAAVEIHGRGVVRTVGDYSEKKLYIIHGSDCKVHELSHPFPRACTDNTTFLGNYTFGVGDDSLLLNAWVGRARGIESVISTTAETCVPVSEAVKGRMRKVSFVLSFGFIDVQAGIKDEKIFDIPSSCESISNFVDPFDELKLSMGVEYMLKKLAQML